MTISYQKLTEELGEGRISAKKTRISRVDPRKKPERKASRNQCVDNEPASLHHDVMCSVRRPYRSWKSPISVVAYNGETVETWHSPLPLEGGW